MENLIPENVIQNNLDPTKLAEYARLTAEESKTKAKREKLNLEIKMAMGQIVIQTLEAAVPEHIQELYSLYGGACGLKSSDPVWKEVAKRNKITADELKGYMYEIAKFLQESSLTEGHLRVLAEDLPLEALTLSPLKIPSGGYVAGTSVQDRSKLNHDLGVAYLKSIGHAELVKTKEVVDEEALKVAVYAELVDADKFRKAAIEPMLVVALKVSKE